MSLLGLAFYSSRPSFFILFIIPFEFKCLTPYFYFLFVLFLSYSIMSHYYYWCVRSSFTLPQLLVCVCVCGSPCLICLHVTLYFVHFGFPIFLIPPFFFFFFLVQKQGKWLHFASASPSFPSEFEQCCKHEELHASHDFLLCFAY